VLSNDFEEFHDFVISSKLTLPYNMEYNR